MCSSRKRSFGYFVNSHSLKSREGRVIFPWPVRDSTTYICMHRRALIILSGEPMSATQSCLGMIISEGICRRDEQLLS